MNELIAMWTARAEQENNHEVALAIMQCVGELKATPKYAEYKEIVYRVAVESDLNKKAYATLGVKL